MWINLLTSVHEITICTKQNNFITFFCIELSNNSLFKLKHYTSIITEQSNDRKWIKLNFKMILSTALWGKSYNI